MRTTCTRRARAGRAAFADVGRFIRVAHGGAGALGSRRVTSLPVAARSPACPTARLPGQRARASCSPGGEGKRLWPLTADRAKPAVPFGGNYRLIDFVLSNLVNAGLHRICVLTQYKSHSLDRHISTTWRLSSVLGQYITTVPAQQRLGRRWYTGSADAIFQSLNLVYDERPDHIVVFGADHVYRMDPGQMLAQHIESGAGVTVAGIRVPRAEAKAFGCIASDESGRITEFLEKPSDPPSVPGRPRRHVRVDGQLRLHHRRAAGGAARRRRGRRLRPRHGRRHHPAPGPRGRRRTSTTSPTTSCPAPPTGTRGYWRDVGTDRRLLRGAHRPGVGAPDLQPLQRALADPHGRRRRCRPPSSSRAASRRTRSSARARSSPGRSCAGR